MGYKLGKMVNKVFILLILTVSVLNADVNNEPSKLFSIEKMSIDKEARIFSIIANPDNIFIKNIDIAKPNKTLFKRFGTVTRKDKYVLSILNSESKQVFLIGLGNPFYIHADHIGHEESNVFGGYIDQELKVAIPLNVKAEYLVLLSQDEFGFKEIKKIKIN